ncbi:MAG: hypothetical protein WCW87_04265 [Candidatus Paceibacterota bacterium]
METLKKLFGGVSKVKLMRLFLFNPSAPFEINEISLRTKTPLPVVKKELSELSSSGLIKRKIFFRELNKKTESKEKIKKIKLSGWILNNSFAYLKPLQELLIDTALLKNEELMHSLKSTGNIKVVIVAGLFLKDFDNRVDLLVVGDKLKPGFLDRAIKLIESEVGKEIRYASLETADFKYRLSICDKLIRDIFDYPHQVILDKTNLL